MVASLIPASLGDLIRRDQPILALAPMQDVTDYAFWKLIASYGGPDLYFTEYFRVTRDSRLDRHILRSITENPTGRPAIAQMIGNDIDAMIRTAHQLQKHPVAGIDLNLGCPAPVVYRKCAGGGLLRDLPRINAILTALRQEITHVPFTVKTRIGFEHPHEFDALLEVFSKHKIDLLTVHARTVREGYRDVVHYEKLRQAAQSLNIPILANGSIDDPASARDLIEMTGARGWMIGRGAIRNPWIFEQIRAAWSGASVPVPIGRDVLEYIHRLYASVSTPGVSEQAQVHRMKKYLNFIGVGVGTDEAFLHAIRRVDSYSGFLTVCESHLDHGEPMPLRSPAFASRSLVAQE